MKYFLWTLLILNVLAVCYMAYLIGFETASCGIFVIRLFIACCNTGATIFLIFVLVSMRRRT